MAGQQSTELQVFLDKRDIICTGILSSYRDVAGRAYQRRLISPGVHRDVTGSNRWSADERVGRFLGELEGTITNDPTALETFVKVLKESDPGFYAVVISTISKT